jgi:hypothetical protein
LNLKPPIFYGFYDYYKPNSFESAIRSSNNKYWREAIEKEISSIKGHSLYINPTPNHHMAFHMPKQF